MDTPKEPPSGSGQSPDPRTPFERFADAARQVFNVPKAAVPEKPKDGNGAGPSKSIGK